MRNVHVQRAVDLLIQYVDKLSEGEALGSPTPRDLKQIFDDHMTVTVAALHLRAHSLLHILLLIQTGILILSRQEYVESTVTRGLQGSLRFAM